MEEKSTYQRWQEEREEKRRGFIDLVQKIASHLEGFSLDDSNNYDAYTYLIHQDGRKLVIRHAYNRLEISGCYHHYSPRTYGVLRYDEKANDSITVSATKPAKAIAKDINRRLMPRYTELFQETMERVEEEKKRHDYAAIQIRELAAILNTEPRETRQIGSRHEILYYGQSVSADFHTTDGESYDANIRRISHDQAKRIAEILRMVV